jgi:hypothetical protein
MQADSTDSQTSLAQASRSTRQVDAPWWYYVAIGIFAGVAVLAIALLPQQIAGLVIAIASVLAGLTSSIARRVSGTRLPVPKTGPGVGYVVVMAVVLVGSLIVAWTVARPAELAWLAWALAALVFVVTLGGTWILRTRRAA